MHISVADGKGYTMQYLYRAYDSEGVLLYVGISGKWSERLHSHEKTSDWMELTDYVKIERFPDRESVEKAERRAIAKEEPLYNKAHNGKYESTQDHFQKLKFWLYYDTPADPLHQPFISAMKSSLKDYPFDYSRKQARYVADIFRDIFDYVEARAEIKWDCRNCRAIRNSGMYMGWADSVLNEWEEIEDDE